MRGAGEQGQSGSEPRSGDPVTDAAILRAGQRAVRIEGESVLALSNRLDGSFVRAARLIFGATGRVVTSGVGKSGLVARKIASTLSSTGTPALFLHPVEAEHGDVGVLVAGDLLILVSRSGESVELRALCAVAGRLELSMLILTAATESSLARRAELVLDVSVKEEACPHGLAPTSSSTAALAMGDALAMAVLELRGFATDDFARLHPAGELGRRLLTRVEDVMLTSPTEVPRLAPGDNLALAMREIAHRRGTVPVTDGEDRVVGVITAGDLTRFAEVHPDFLSRQVRECMTRTPKTADPRLRASLAVREMESHGVMALPVVDGGGRLIGIVHLHDLLRAGVR
ncbi:MAG: SIS domain-containing protein [Gemmatimonadota bacterium]